MAVAFPNLIAEEITKQNVSELTNQNCITIDEARNAIKAKFTNFRRLLDKNELELSSELNQIEETNKPELTQVQHDIDQLNGVMKNLDDSLGANTLKPFLEEQKNLLNKQLQHFENSKKLLSNITLEYSNLERLIGGVIEIIPFNSKARFREKLEPTLELEPEEDEVWYVVSKSWFSDFSDSINLDNPQPNDSWEFPQCIPIDHSGIYTNGKIDANKISLLHSDAWNMLLGFNGLSVDSSQISRKAFHNEITGLIEVPLNQIYHTCLIGHIDTTNTFGIKMELECYPSETYGELLDKFFTSHEHFSTHSPQVFAFNEEYAITSNSPKFDTYTVGKPIPLPNPPVQNTGLQSASRAPYNYKPPSQRGLFTLTPTQDLDEQVGLNNQSILFVIPDSEGNTNIEVVSHLPELK